MSSLQLIAVAIVRHGDSFLIGIRPAGVPLAGCSEFPGGKVRPGETAEQAAARECLEETGLAVKVCGEYPEVLFDYEHGSLHLRFFDCRLTDSANERPAPATPFRWVDRLALATLSFPPANRDVIRLLTS